MSLQVWLPLNGNLNNNGLYDLDSAVVQNGVTVDDNGKIGKCYTNTSTYACVETPLNITINKFSLCGWIKFNVSSANWARAFGLILSDGYIGIGCEHSNGTALGHHYYKAIDGTNTGIFDAYKDNIQFDTWVHYGVCYDGAKYYLYTNGQLVYSANAALNTTSTVIALKLFGGYNGYHSKCSLNDIRLYDHCLSAKEIKEINKGLCLHYKLDGMGGYNYIHNSFSPTYYMSGSDYPNHTKRTNGCVENIVADGAYANAYCWLSNDSSQYADIDPEAVFTPGQYTMSVDVKTEGFSVVEQDKISLHVDWGKFGTYNVSYRATAYINETCEDWHRISATVNITDTTDLIKVLIAFIARDGSDFSKTLGAKVYYRRWKLERGNVATPWTPNGQDNLFLETEEFDHSGFNHKGTHVCPNRANLLKNSLFSGTGTWYGVNSSTINTAVINNRTVLTGAKGTSAYYLYGQTLELTHTAGVTQTLYFSADVYSEYSQKIQAGVWLITTQASGWQSAGTITFVSDQLNIGWNHVKARIVVTHADYSGNIVVAFGCSSTTMSLYHPKISISSDETPYIPHTSEAGYSSFKKTYYGFMGESGSPRYLSSYKFKDENSQYIYTNHLDFLSNKITFSCWVKQLSYQRSTYSGFGNGGQFIISQGRDYSDPTGANNNGFNLYSSAGVPSVYCGLTYTNAGMTMVLNTWYHLATTYDGSNVKIYVNGELKSTAAVSTPPQWTNNSGVFCVGKMAYGYTGEDRYFPFVGNISDVRVYSTALSAEDIKELYNVSGSIDNSGNVYAYELKEG